MNGLVSESPAHHWPLVGAPIQHRQARFNATCPMVFKIILGTE